MTLVNYYILPDSFPQARENFACRLLQQTSRLGHRIYIHCDNPEQAKALDEYLWQFQAQSFLPHKLLDAQGAACSIEIGAGNEPGNHDDLLINLSQTIPPFYSRFQRVVEIVSQEPQCLIKGREKYRFYKERNYPLKHIDLRKKTS